MVQRKSIMQRPGGAPSARAAVPTTSRPPRPAQSRASAPTRAPTSRTLDEVKRAHDATGDEFMGAQLFTPDTQRDLPWGLDTPDLHAGLGANKWALNDEKNAFTLSGNRGGFALSQRPEIGVEQLALSGFKNIGAAGAGASYALHHDEAQTVRLGLDAFGAHNLAGIAPSWNWSDGTGARAGVGIGVFGAAGFSVHLLESYDEPDDPKAGMALVEVRREANPGIAFDPARAMNVIGMGAKFCFTKGERTVYSTMMPQRELGEVLRSTNVNRQGVRGLLARMGAATGVTGAPVPMADVHDPLNMLGRANALQIGERLVHTFLGSSTVGAAPGMWGIRAGFFHHRNDVIAFTVERIDRTRVSVTVAPRHLHAVSMGVDALLVADARREMSHSKASCHTLIFDFDQPEALTAYRQLMRKPQAFDVETCAAVPGVRMTARESTSSRMHRDGAGIPRPPLLAQLKIAGIGRHSIDLEQEHEVPLGDVTHKIRRLARDTQTYRAWGGEAHVRVDAQLHTRQVHGDMQAEFAGVSLSLAFEYDRITGADVRWLRRTLRTLSGETLPNRGRGGHGHDYTVVVDRVLAADDFSHLAQQTPESVHSAAKRAGAEPRVLEKIVVGIKTHQGDIHSLGHMLCEQLAKCDVATWSALCHLAPTGSQTRVKVSSRAFTATVASVREFLIENAVTPRDAKSNEQIRRKIHKLRRDVSRALSQVENDVLLERYDDEARRIHIGNLLWCDTVLDEAADARAG